jgi:hypothetical protein
MGCEIRKTLAESCPAADVRAIFAAETAEAVYREASGSNSVAVRSGGRYSIFGRSFENRLWRCTFVP